MKGGNAMTTKNKELCDWMKENGLTAEQLATKIGRSTPAVNAYRQGKKFPSRLTLIRMKKIGMPIEQIFLNEEEK